ncbi:MAG: ATP-dependent DNA helicase RecG [Kofleriaceae bacterium]
MPAVATGAERRRALDALRRPLELAAADQFAGVARIAGLGGALRAHASAAQRLWPEHDGLRTWRERLDDFDGRSHDDQAVEVARGLRVVAGLAAELPPPPAKIAARPGRAPTAAPVEVAAPAPASPAKAAARPRGAGRARGSAPVAGGDPLAASPQVIKGIGLAFAAAMAERGIATVEDLLWLLPRRYDDVRRATPLAQLAATTADGDRCVVAARVQSARMIFVRGRRWCDARFQDRGGGPATLVVRWFGVRGPMDQRLPAGAEVVLAGRRKDRGGTIEMANPDIVSIVVPGQPAPPAPGIVPRYLDIPGLPAARLRTAASAACAQFATVVDDGVPAAVLAEAGLAPLGEALHALHAPPATLGDDDVAAIHAGTSRWHRRLAFGELLVLGAAVARRRRARQGDLAEAFPPAPGDALARELAARLLFALTAAQARCVDELRVDLAQPRPMNRLLQGDVGSGKTAVAFAAALQVIRAGGQVAIMAPTELLAEQHERTLGGWARAAGLRTALLTASTPRGTRQSLLALLAAGQLDLVMGTHALLADGVQFARLGLVVIDEQHRFGVAQRVRLRHKGDAGAPHLLVVTATPIPRTLALTAYGDLEVSTLDELPPGGRRRRRGCSPAPAAARPRSRGSARRWPAASAPTWCVRWWSRPSPATRRAGWRDATSVAEELAAALAPTPVALLHGRLDAVARDAAMSAFRSDAAPVLVATTVIEVGVDVPEATVMVIEDADHFGLAQLHQLRGRIGRGGGASECLLCSRGAASELGGLRLAAMVESADGFRIAERDLELRGPGELLGARQAGLPQLRFGDAAEHTALLLEARRAAEGILDRDPELLAPAHAGLAAALRRRSGGGVYGAEGG